MMLHLNNRGGFYDNEIHFYVDSESENVEEWPPAQVFLLPSPAYDKALRDTKLRELLSISRKKNVS